VCVFFFWRRAFGGVESLVILPIYSSHYNMTNEELQARGESVRDRACIDRSRRQTRLIEDLKQALT